MDVKAASGEGSEEVRSTIEKALSIIFENILILTSRMLIGTFGESSGGNEEQVIVTGEKAVLVTEWQKT